MGGWCLCGHLLVFGIGKVHTKTPAMEEKCICLTLFLFLCFGANGVAAAKALSSLVKCLDYNIGAEGGSVIVVHRNASFYNELFECGIKNLRHVGEEVPRPGAIVIPKSYNQVRSTVICCRSEGWHMCIRSGGHSYESFSSWFDVPFIVLDMRALDWVSIDATTKTAWVESGATLGMLYSAIAKSSNTLAFPAGTCPTVNIGGQLSGGGVGMLARSFGLSNDLVEDALLVDSKGRILNRSTMGEDVFWAIRGGGGGTWGVVLKWKIKLLEVPPLLTVFSVNFSHMDDITDMVYKWQLVAPYTDDELFLRVSVTNDAKHKINNPSVNAQFYGLYLGGKDRLTELMGREFPELGITAEHCSEMSFIDTVHHFGDYFKGETLVARHPKLRTWFKGKSDFGKDPIPKDGLTGIWKMMSEMPESFLLLQPLGGAMARVSSEGTPFPFREGYTWFMHYGVFKTFIVGGSKLKWECLQWARKVHRYMGQYVPLNPRGAYVNYVDLDLGYAFNGTTTIEQATSWGRPYFMSNYERLVKAKTQIDPINFFRNPQCIPPQFSYPFDI